MANVLFDKFPYHVAVGDIDCDADTFKAALIKDTYTPDSTDEVFSDISAHESDATNYTAGGYTLENISVAEASGTTKIDADNFQWNTLTGTGIKYLAIYVAAASNYLCCLLELSQVRAPSAENLAITFDDAGFINFASA